MADKDGYTHKHLKRGTRYKVIGQARLQCSTMPPQDGDMLTLYQGEDGIYSVRHPAEFGDGRFVELNEGDGLPVHDRME